MNIYQTTDYKLIAKLNEHVHSIHAKLYPEYFKDYNYVEIKAFFKQIIHDNHFTFLVIEDNGENLGYAWIEMRNYPESPFTKAYKSVFVHQFSIASSKRNQGYGTKLMEAIYETARKHHIKKIELDYWSNNDKAKNFYQKNGFTIYREFVYKRI